MNLGEISTANIIVISFFASWSSRNLLFYGRLFLFLLSSTADASVVVIVDYRLITLHTNITDKKSHKCMPTGQPHDIRGKMCLTKEMQCGRTPIQIRSGFIQSQSDLIPILSGLVWTWLRGPSIIIDIFSSILCGGGSCQCYTLLGRYIKCWSSLCVLLDCEGRRTLLKAFHRQWARPSRSGGKHQVMTMSARQSWKWHRNGCSSWKPTISCLISKWYV